MEGTIRVVVIAVSILAVLGAIFAWVTRDGYNFNNTKRGVYNLDMQNNVRVFVGDGKKRKKTYVLNKWRMDIPRKYIRSHYGKNGHPNFVPGGGERNGFKMTLFTLIDTETMTVKPDPNVLNGYPLPNQMVLRLSNGRPVKEIREAVKKDDVCFTQSQMNEDVMGRKPRARTECGPTKKLCPLRMYVDGWPVRVSLQRSLHEANPQAYCNLAKEFLNSLTLERDSLLDVGLVE